MTLANDEKTLLNQWFSRGGAAGANPLKSLNNPRAS
jgi:hypothetical protein